ncbi:MAG: hypothetical protein WAT09_05670 [Paracoccaceae bacterium]
MLKLIVNSRRYVALFLSLVVVGLAGVVYQGIQKDEIEKALALRQGVPSAVSLNAFDPGRDIHAAADNRDAPVAMSVSNPVQPDSVSAAAASEPMTEAVAALAERASPPVAPAVPAADRIETSLIPAAAALRPAAPAAALVAFVLLARIHGSLWPVRCVPGPDLWDDPA